MQLDNGPRVNVYVQNMNPEIAPEGPARLAQEGTESSASQRLARELSGEREEPTAKRARLEDDDNAKTPGSDLEMGGGKQVARPQLAPPRPRKTPSTPCWLRS